MNDRYDLQRFVDAQESIYAQVLKELKAGRKSSHWMWFIFPQLSGLGYSSMARRYAISGRDEALAYSEHPVLGPRLRECTALINNITGSTIHQILGTPDDLKFRSSMTLFSRCSRDPQIFLDALDRYFEDGVDPATVKLLL